MWIEIQGVADGIESTSPGLFQKYCTHLSGTA